MQFIKKPSVELSIEDVVSLLWRDGAVDLKGRIQEAYIAIPKLKEILRGTKQEGNWIIVEADNITFGLEGIYYSLALYPEPNFALELMLNEVKEGGHKLSFPGGVATLNYSCKSKKWEITDLQNLFKHPVSEQITRYYGYARDLLLNYFFSCAASQGVSTIHYIAYREEVHNLTAKQEKITKIAKIYGYVFSNVSCPDTSSREILELIKR